MRRSPRRRHSTSKLPLLAALAVALFASQAHALHRESPGAMRITRSASHQHSAGRMWGNDMAFVSTADLAFTGNNTQQIFHYSLFQWVCQNGEPTPNSQEQCPNPPVPWVQQVTTGPGLPGNPSISQTAGTCELLPTRGCSDLFDCQTDGDYGNCILNAQWVAFDALGVFGGGTGPQAERRQIFLKNVKTNELRRVTAGTDGNSTNPSVNLLAGVVTFESTASLGGPNPGGISQIFVYERRTNVIRQITFGQGPSRRAIPNRTGELIVFESRADLLGNGNDTGIWQIYWAQYDRATHEARIFRLTNGNADSINGYISEIERRITFESTATDLGGTPGGSNIYRADFAPIPPQVSQLTQQQFYGDCHHPTLSTRGDRVAFTCTGDPLQNGTTGLRLFVLEDITNGLKLRQITGQGDVPGPVSHALGLWFLSFATTSDLDGDGSCGSQLYSLNYFDQEGPGHWQAADELGELPPDVNPPPPPGGTTGVIIGRRNFAVHPGNELAGSTARLVTRDGVLQSSVVSDGFFALVIGAPSDVTRLSSINVPASLTSLPSVSIPNVGVLCMEPTEDGGGFIDCEGANTTGELLISQDHNVDDSDPGCVLGCRESALGQTVGGGTECRGDWPGPHQVDCPICVAGFCDSGFNAGQPCANNGQCQPSECLNGLMGVCNGPIEVSSSGTTAAGDMQLRLPINISLSTNAGIDGTRCTADDAYAVTDFPADLRLTTGAITGALTDVDNQAGATLSSATLGAPFSCASLEAGETYGARLVGSLPLIDVPNVPGLRDGILDLRYEPRPEPGVCDVVCTSSIDCGDGDACNGLEACINGVCIAGTPVPPCDDSDVCNGTETCDPGTGSCLPGIPCDDLDPCNGQEVCDQSTGCLLGTPVVCTDSDACNGLETCDPTTGGCLSGTPPACDDGDACNGVETCDPAIGCQAGTGVDCQDADLCNGTEGCDATTGTCLPPPAPLDCDDGNVCTDDSCDPLLGCQHVDNASTCDDGSACTTGDACTAGSCAGTPNVFCDDSDVCNGLETCDPANGLCLPGIPQVCDDLNVCTDDSCDSLLGCLFVPNILSCDDTNLCTIGDVCALGLCVGVPVLCDDGDACNGTETCDPGSGSCATTGPLDCDDDNPCTDEVCDPLFGCGYTNNSNSCDDGNLCTSGEACVAGACAGGTPVVCDDGDVCNGNESCDPGTGNCTTTGPLACDDGNACTNDTCDPVFGCVFSNNNASCNDGDLCTSGDVCGGGSCGGTPVTCDDNNVCNGIESCDPGTGACTTTGALDCDDENVCTNDSCNPLLGCVHVNNNNSCDDGDVCTDGDVCSGGECVSGTDIQCVMAALESLIGSASTEDLGGTRPARRFLTMAVKARVRVDRALIGNPLDRAKQFTRAKRILVKMVRRIDRSVNRSRIDLTLAQQMRDLDEQAMAEIDNQLLTL